MSTEPSKHTKIELTIEELKEIVGTGSSGQVLANEDEIDLLELWNSLVERKWLILSLTFMVTLSAAIASLLMTPKYESTAVVYPVTVDSSAGLLSKYGGLASMAGISLPDGSEGVSLSQEALTILKSHRFLAEFIEEKKLKPILFYKNWDSDLEKWIVAETSWLSGLKEVILGKPEKTVSYPGQEKLEDGEPSMQKAVNLFLNQVLSISEDEETGLIKLKITWKNPVEAKIWANELIQRVDDELRHKAIAESKQMVDYIKGKLPTIELQNVRVIALNIIEDQVKKATFARVNKEYVFTVVDPAIVAEKPVSPKRKLIVVVGFVLGLMFSVFVALILSWRKKSKNL